MYTEISLRIAPEVDAWLHDRGARTYEARLWQAWQAWRRADKAAHIATIQEARRRHSDKRVKAIAIDTERAAEISGTAADMHQPKSRLVIAAIIHAVHTEQATKQAAHAMRERFPDRQLPDNPHVLADAWQQITAIETERATAIKAARAKVSPELRPIFDENPGMYVDLPDTAARIDKILEAAAA